jgi:hypothetical protein
MSLEDLGNIGEFVAALAVLVSLIYLASKSGKTRLPSDSAIIFRQRPLNPISLRGSLKMRILRGSIA